MKRFLSLFIIFCMTLALIVPIHIEAAALRLNKTKATMEMDSTLKLKLGSVKASDIKWKSSHPKVVSVSKAGTISAKSEGKATILAKYKDKTYTCYVKVVDSNRTDTKKDYYSLGETFTVEGEWSITFDSVTIVEYRDPNIKQNPKQVILLKYTYENIGYEGHFLDLYITDMDLSVVDEKGEVASHYDIETYTSPQTTPIGGKCVGAELAFGLNNESKTITVHLLVGDKYFHVEEANFKLKVD